MMRLEARWFVSETIIASPMTDGGKTILMSGLTAETVVIRHRRDGPRSSRRLPSCRRRPARRRSPTFAAIVLAGMAGRDGWSAFAASPEAADGADHPLDRWSRRVIEGSGARPRRACPVPVRRTAVLAVPAMGAALGAGASLADRSSDPSALRTLAQLPWSARRFARRSMFPNSRASPSPCELLPRTLVLERLSRRRVLSAAATMSPPAPAI